MRISSADAADQLEDLVERAEAGEEIILTDGDIAIRLVPVVLKADHQNSDPATTAKK